MFSEALHGPPVHTSVCKCHRRGTRLIFRVFVLAPISIFLRDSATLSPLPLFQLCPEDGQLFNREINDEAMRVAKSRCKWNFKQNKFTVQSEAYVHSFFIRAPIRGLQRFET